MTSPGLPPLPRSAGGTRLRWRPPTTDDIPAWERLMDAIERVDATGEVLTADDLADEFATSWMRPEANARFAFEPGRRCVAFGWLQAQPQHDRPHRFTLWGGVDPAWRGAGIGRALLPWLEARARQVYGEFDDGLGGHVTVNCDEGHADRRRLLERSGYTLLRTWYEMERPLDGVLPAIEVPAGLRFVPLDPTLDDAARAAHNEAFADHWGFRPADPETWSRWYVGHRDVRRDLSRVALDGEEIAGYAVNAIHPQDFAAKGRSEGWIATLAVRRPWRGRGVASALLAEACKAFAADGLAYAVLGVDAESLTGAVRLYERVGFTTCRRTLTYAKPLP